MEFGKDVADYESPVPIMISPHGAPDSSEDDPDTTPKDEMEVSMFPPNHPPVPVEWDGKQYLLSHATIDKLSFHSYFAIKTALEWHRERKFQFDERHLRMMVGLGSIVRCGGGPKELCTKECKTFGL